MAGPKYVTDFEFPRSAGFSGSADHAEGLRNVRGYNRRPPVPGFAKGGVVKTTDEKPKEEPKKEEPKKDMIQSAKDRVQAARERKEKEAGLKKGGAVKKYAKGGSVDSSVITRTEPTTQRDAEHGGKGPLSPGFRAGGKAKALGGPVKYARGGRTSTKMNDC